ncbi:4-hydroxyphenylacetate 3-monooxygenase, oxygenase component [Neobacillus dielmonensis]|uniref:4-hydroxyphenylacetate 3-monooxygenase, oxygenase component n=1 Tax=Neobacillus dielmonensis TaxID=1347369 RepID=UPI0005A9042E|nr:4-hydroxyphenylacetate 3-monooxygenase, oxygenase component [Neobacillus dielmonensis]
MSAISGKDYINRIDQLQTEIWLDGQRIEGKISEHPAFKGIIQTKASLYDLQKNPQFQDEMTYDSPESANPIGLSYLQPRTKEDILKRRKMMEIWARHTHGLLGRSPDYMNSALMAFASSRGFLKDKKHCFPENIEALYKRARENDLSFTHTFVNPQVNRSQYYFENSKEPIAAKMVGQNEKGIIIKGARLLATQGGLTDEVLVFSNGGVTDEEHAFAFSIPSDTPGVKFICRESFVNGESLFNYPLSSRYEEMDTMVVFDHVLVPWDRIFYYNNVDAAIEFVPQSSFQSFAYHQVITRQVVKTGFILGIAELLVDTINVSGYQHIQEKLSEIIIGLETMKALLEKSEEEAKIDEWGIMRPSIIPLQVASNIYPRIYPRFVEIIQLIGASGMVSLPSEKDFASTIKEDLGLYLQAANRDAEDRVKIFRLAWDLTMSPFGTRQTQYERYFFGDPIRLSSYLYHSYPKEKYMKQVVEFLNLNP